jgi:5-methylcytosine-specific restriction endonuclease McrA
MVTSPGRGSRVEASSAAAGALRCEVRAEGSVRSPYEHMFPWSGVWLTAQLESGRHPSTVAYWARRYGLASAHAGRHAPRGGIARELLEELVDEGLNIRAIADRLGCSYGTVKHWLREHDLRTRRSGGGGEEPSRGGAVVWRECRSHGFTEFVRRADNSGWRCLRCRAEAVTRRRQRVKQILVAEAGGRCAVCGYDRCHGALEFHHLHPKDKRFALSALSVARSIERARAEAGKCVLLCANCHSEVQAGLVAIACHPSPPG